MLLIEAPLTPEEWTQSRVEDPSFQMAFSAYCARYRAAVLALPKQQLLKIWEALARELRQCDVSPELLHVIVEREIREAVYEASSKAAKLIVLTALAHELARRGFRLTAETNRRLEICQRRIPQILAFAVSDHYGFLQVG